MNNGFPIVNNQAKVQSHQWKNRGQQSSFKNITAFGKYKGWKNNLGLLGLFSLYKDDADKTKEEKQNMEKIKNIKDDSNEKKQYIIQGE